MKITVELSHYPLSDAYERRVRGFIDYLHDNQNIKVKTNGVSTQIFGEYAEVMGAVTKAIEKSFAEPHAVFVMKIINADLEKEYVYTDEGLRQKLL